MLLIHTIFRYAQTFRENHMEIIKASRHSAEERLEEMRNVENKYRKLKY